MVIDQEEEVAICDRGGINFGKNKELQATIDSGPTVTADTDDDDAAVSASPSHAFNAENWDGNKHIGRYADLNEGAGTMNKLKHLCRAVKCRDWPAAEELVCYMESSNETMEKLLDGWSPDSMSSSSGNKRQRR